VSRWKVPAAAARSSLAPHISLIAHPKDRIATLHEVQSLPFYNRLPFAQLRDIPAPFVPMLESDSDVGYFDAFDSPEDMAKYAEVFKKQADVDAVAEKGAGGRNAWVSWAWAFVRIKHFHAHFHAHFYL
jgi:hypothetical protein